MKDPVVQTAIVITDVMSKGSAKDGCDESWRGKDELYHLIKAQSHLATHLKQQIDPRTKDGEDHLAAAITRLAMALCAK